jgi:serine/threonine protein kinase
LNISSGPFSVAAVVQEGDVIAGKYRVDRILGRGGMGIVVAARHIQLDEKVALKFLLPAALSNPEALGRFAREARAAVKIKSEHVARIIDIGELENGLPYMVMEYLEGSDLSTWLAGRGPLEVEQAVAFLLQACEALAEAHALGIVHRDLKPSNLFLATRPSGPPIVKVLDFGISKSAFSASQGPITTTSGIIGSPLYMSPEQMHSSRTIDGRSDIWALGVVLYELLARKPPFPGKSLPELITSVLHREPDSLCAARSDVSPAFEKAVNRCLAKDPVDRFANVGEMAAALAPFGPPRCDVSVERITHVLGLGGARSPAASLTPVENSITLKSVAHPPVASTVLGATTPPAGATPARPVPPEALLASGIASLPISGAVERSSRGSGRFAVVATAVVLGAGGMVAWGAISTSTHETLVSTHETLAVAVREPPPVTSSPPPAATVIAVPVLAMASPVATPVTPSSRPSSQEPSGGAKPPLPPPRVKPAPAPSSSASASAPRPNCNPPYVLDSANHRQYKPECY